MPGIVKCGGTEGEIVVAHGCRKRKKLICGTEGKIEVAHGRLPSPARCAGEGGGVLVLSLEQTGKTLLLSEIGLSHRERG